MKFNQKVENSQRNSFWSQKTGKIFHPNYIFREIILVTKYFKTSTRPIVAN